MFTSASSNPNSRPGGFLLRLASAPTSGGARRRESLVELVRPVVIEPQGYVSHLQRAFPAMTSKSDHPSARSHRLQVEPANNRRAAAAAAADGQEACPSRENAKKNQLLTIEFNSRAAEAGRNLQQPAERKQARLAQQVERTFRRKILGNLIVATLAGLCLLALAGPFQANCQSPAAGELANEPDKQTTTSAPDSSPITGQQQPANKLKPVNFSLVEEIFNSALSEPEVVKRWRFMDTQLQEGMKSILKMLFPQIVAISQDAKVSGDCSGGILKWILSLRNLRSWAMKMLDATGKPSSGIFEGSLTMFGNYKQCLNIRAPDEDEIEITDQFEEYFRGQYCVIHLKPWMPIKQPFYHLNSSIESLLRKNYKYYEKTLYDELAEIAIAFNFVDIRLDLCVPSTCTVADIQRVAELLSKKVEMRAKVIRCDIAPRERFTLFGSLDRLTLAWLALPVCLLALSICSTLIQLIVNYSTKEAFEQQQSLLFKVTNCLSLQNNLRELSRKPKCCLFSKNSSGSMNLKTMELSISNSPNKLQNGPRSDLEMNQNQRSDDTPVNSSLLKPLPLYGLRNLFVLWFIIVQLTVELKYQYLRESLPLRDMIVSQWPMQLIVNSTLLFESLILITAFTFSYTCLECNLKQLIKYILDKYLRLTLSIVSLIGLTIVTPQLNIESPIWKNLVDQQSMACKSTGYLNLFFLQNFISYDKICLPHTWLFSIELQLIVLSVPLMLLLKQAYQKLENTFIGSPENGSLNQSNYQLKFENFTERQLIWQTLKSTTGLLQLGLIATGALINFLTVYSKQLPPSWFYTFPDSAQKNFYFSEYLMKTWTHLSVFMVGLLAGHICRTVKQMKLLRDSSRRQTKNISGSGSPETGSTLTIAPTLDLSSSSQHNLEVDLSNSESATTRAHSTSQRMFQAAGLVCMLAIIFSTFSWSTQQLPGPLAAALYDSMSRLIWSLALVYLMVGWCLADEVDGCSIVRRILCHPVCSLLGKLSFLAYLISPYVNAFILALQEQALFPSIYMIFHLIVGNIVIIYALASFLSVSVEQPVRRLMSRFLLSLF